MHYLILTSLLWAFSFGLIGSALKGINPLQVADVRLLLALLVFIPFLKLQQITFSERLQLIALGAVQYGVMFTCYLSAFNYLPSHLVALFSVTTPLYVVIIHAVKQRSFTPTYLVAALLSIAGAAVIKAKGIDNPDIWLGFGLMQIANLAFGFGQVYYRDWKLNKPEVTDSSVFALLYLGGALLTALATILLNNQSPIPEVATSQQWMVMIYLGAIASGMGFFMWNKGATQTTPGILAAFNNAVVPLAMFASLFIFGEAANSSSEDLIRLAMGSLLIGSAVFVGKKRS